jgi:hypothetical protein
MEHECGWIWTVTGKRFRPLDPREDDVCVEDIAWSLAKICRFGGHTPVHYSVAQHCVEGARVLKEETGDPGLALAFLLHDASEAYLGDMVRPIKHLPDFAFYREAEERLQCVLARKFEVSFDRPEVAAMDDRMLATELRDIMQRACPTLVAEPLLDKLVAWPWKKAGERYLDAFRSLLVRRTFSAELQAMHERTYEKAHA